MVVVEKVKVSWAKLGRFMDQLAEDLSEYKFDRVIGISRGGLIPGVFLSHKFNAPFTAVGVSSYNDETHLQESLICDTPDVIFEGWEGLILIVDDIADSGKTLQFLQSKIAHNDKISVVIATLYYKEGSIVKPDYYVETTSRWIVFPWECDD
jgi:hypoxanthine phosphoribosyltransferase